MTISLVPEDSRVRRFACTGGETVFAITFPVFAASDVRVLRQRGPTVATLAQPADYAVAGAGGPSGFTVTLAAPALAGDVLAVVGAQPVARSSEWLDGQALRAAALNSEFARWWMALQQAQRDAGRALRVSILDAAALDELPAAAQRAGRFLGFDAAGQPRAMAAPDVPLGAVARAGDVMTGPLEVVNASAPEHALNRAAGDVRYARPRSRIINGAMQISQQHGGAAVDVTTGIVYTLDQWMVALSATPGGTLRAQQQAVPTPGGSRFRLRLTAQAADTAIAAGDAYMVTQPLEGLVMADARFGTAAARRLLLRFGVRSTVAGTFGVAVRNGAGTRSWIGTFTIAPAEVGQDVAREMPIPGDVTGAWPSDHSLGMRVSFVLAAGTSHHGVAGWQGSDLLTTAAQVNFMGVAGASFDLFDVGLYVDALGDLHAAPAWEMPDEAEELQRCQRYLEQLRWSLQWIAPAGGDTAGAPVAFQVRKRAVPAIASYATLLASNAAGFNFLYVSEQGALGQLTSVTAGSSAIVLDLRVNARL